MKISGINKVTEVYKNNSIQKASGVAKVEKKDEVQLSKTAIDFQIALKALGQVPDIRESKIQEVQQKLASGTYHVDAKEVADKMVERSFDAKI